MQDNQQNDSILDELLDVAQWPEVGQDRLGRLERRWDQLRRRQRVVAGSAIAALLLLPLAAAIGFSTLRNPTRRVDRRESVQVVSKRPVVPRSPHVSSPEQTVQRPRLTEAHRGREANTYERAVLLLHRARIARAREAAKVETEDPFAAAVAAVVAGPEEDIATVVDRLVETYPNCEDRLSALVWTTQGSKREAAIRLLAPLATRRSLGVLLECSRQPEHPLPAIGAVARLSTATELAALARTESDPNLARRWMAALARRESPDAIRQFLALVEDPVQSTMAISACSDVSWPVVEAWFAALDSRRVITRLAAARALGSLNDPRVSAQLARLAMEYAGRPEVLAGLLTSTDEVAEEFCRFARDDARLWPTLRAIDLRLRHDGELN